MADADGAEGWLQRLVACALAVGISKRELLEDYYFDEIGAVVEAWNALHRPPDEADEPTDPMAFLGEGGERIV